MLTIIHKPSMFFLFFVSGFLFSTAQENFKETLPGTDHSLDLVFVKGGAFTMGSSRLEVGHFGDEGPQHEVAVDAFWMGQFEVHGICTIYL